MREAHESAVLPIFLSNHSGDDVLRAYRAAPRREPSIVLSRTLVREIRAVTGFADAHEPTVFLLRVEHRRKPSAWRRVARALVAIAAVLACVVVACVLTAALGCALAGG